MAHRKVRAPEKTLAVVDHNVPTTDRSHGIADPESRLQVRDAGGERARLRHRVFQRTRPPPGHRPHHRAGAGLHAARHDHRLRRQPHLDARRLRRAGARHRHQRGGACARHADADPAQGEEHARLRRRQAAGRRDGEGRDPFDHRRDRHRRRHRQRHRIFRRRDPRAFDGRPHDGLQHVDRRRRARRHDRARRDDLRLHQGSPARPEGQGVGHGARLVGDAPDRRRARISTAK